MSWDHIEAISSFVIALGVIVGGLWQLWRSISDRFDGLEQKRDVQFSSLKDYVTGLYDKQEDVGLQRHEANLRQFTKIYVALAQLGWRNGTNGS